MITFSYQARDAAGRIVSGVQEALNEDNAVTSLMSRGLMVLSLQRKATASQSRRKSTTVKETDLVLFTRQLSTMMNFDRVRQFRKVLAQSQSNLFRGGADICENNDRLA